MRMRLRIKGSLNKRIKRQLETANENERPAIECRLQEIRNERARNETVREQAKGSMRLKDSIKEIFKKHGFTVVAVLTAVGAVIGAVTANLKNGLATLGKDMGIGLKAIGKKPGQILSGMIGSIASFIFRTAGEVLGFLAKHAWLLKVAVVIYAIEQFKKKRS